MRTTDTVLARGSWDRGRPSDAHSTDFSDELDVFKPRSASHKLKDPTGTDCSFTPSTNDSSESVSMAVTNSLKARRKIAVVRRTKGASTSSRNNGAWIHPCMGQETFRMKLPGCV